MEGARLQVCGESSLLQPLLTQEKLQLDGWYRQKQCMTANQLDTKYGQRKECGRQIQAMCSYFEFSSPAVFAYSMAVMDCALVRVNIPWKYLSCFSAACLVIGNKWVEDESNPTLQEFAELHSRQWKEGDLRRMEERILQVLGWALPRTTYLCFLTHVLHTLSDHQLTTTTTTVPLPHLPLPLARSSVASQAVRNAELLLLNEFSFVLKPAALALGAVEQALKQSGGITPDVAASIVSLQDTIKVLDSELHEVGAVLSRVEADSDSVVQGGEDKMGFRINQAYFPKVFETPCDSFLPDYRLHPIPEECSSINIINNSSNNTNNSSNNNINNNNSTNNSTNNNITNSNSNSSPHEHRSDVDADSSPNTSISDYDYSEEEDERTDHRMCVNGGGEEEVEEEEEESCESTSGSSTGDGEGSEPSDVSAAEEVSEAAAGISSDGVNREQLANRAAMTVVEGRGRMPRDEDSDSGCEDEDDEDEDEEEREDGGGCEGRRPCEEEVEVPLCVGVGGGLTLCSSSDPESSDPDLDPDSDFHDCSPCSVAHVKACLTDSHASVALTFA